MSKFIPYGRQLIDDEDVQAVVEVLKSDFLTTGPMVKAFEDALCGYLGSTYAVAVSNGTAALHLSCLAAGIKPGDEVIVPPITFAATANAVLYCGGIPVFADIDDKTYNISVEAIEKLITANTKAIIPVHFTGQPCDMNEIIGLAKKYNLIVIEDGAHVLGGEYKGEKVSCIGDMLTISFHPVKHITTGEGGVILTNSEEYYNRLKRLRTHGITKDYVDIGHADEPWFYEQQDLGFNYRITDFQCALGIAQLRKIDKFLNRRREIANMYNELLANIDGIILPYQHKEVSSAWHLYIIQFNQKIHRPRKEIFNDLKEMGLGVNVHYIPVYYHPYYKKLGYKKGLCPKAEKLYDQMMTIPLHPGMSDDDVRYVVNCIKKVVGAK